MALAIEKKIHVSVKSKRPSLHSLNGECSPLFESSQISVKCYNWRHKMFQMKEKRISDLEIEKENEKKALQEKKNR